MIKKILFLPRGTFKVPRTEVLWWLAYKIQHLYGLRTLSVDLFSGIVFQIFCIGQCLLNIMMSFDIQAF